MRLCTLTIAFVLMMMALTMGNTACNPDNVPIGDESDVITQAWDYETKNLTEQVQRLELVVQLQKREFDRILAEREWLYVCFSQTNDPDQFPHFSQFGGQFGGWLSWCEEEFGQ